MKLFEELKRRGLTAQMTNEEKLEELLNAGGQTFYIGFDATADSLHIGHFLQMVVIKHMQNAGHRPIVLFGTGTTMIGDPTGKTELRKMLTAEEINYNAECFRKQMSRFIEFGDEETKARIVKNGDWLMNLNYIDLLREIGVHFTVNRMLAAECFKSRYEKGLSFIEFNYMIMQSYDFLYLNRKFDCTIELGGDDQWSNILGGIDLVRRCEGKEVYGMTFTLLANKDGKKMGKTEKGALWLDEDKTSSYEFFQYWRNVDDADVFKCLKMLTFIPVEEIEQMEKWDGTRINEVKEIFAFEITKMVHGEQKAQTALETSIAVFSGQNAENMPGTILSDDDFEGDSIGLLDMLVKCGLAASKGEGRRLVEQGGITIDGEKITDVNLFIEKSRFENADIIVKKGKKVFRKVTFN